MDISEVKYGQVLAKHGTCRRGLPDVVVVDRRDYLLSGQAISVAVLFDDGESIAVKHACTVRIAMFPGDLQFFRPVLDTLDFFGPFAKQPEPQKSDDTAILDFLETAIEKIDLTMLAPQSNDGYGVMLVKDEGKRINLRSAVKSLKDIRNRYLL